MWLVSFANCTLAIRNSKQRYLQFRKKNSQHHLMPHNPRCTRRLDEFSKKLENMLIKKNYGLGFLILLSIPALLYVIIATLCEILCGVDFLISCFVMFLSVAVLLWNFWPNRKDTWQNLVVILCTMIWFFAIWLWSDAAHAHLLYIFLSALLPLSAIFVYAKETPLWLKVCAVVPFVGIGLYNVYHNDIMDPTEWWCRDIDYPSPWPLSYRCFWSKEIVNMTVWTSSILSFLLITGYKVFRKWKSR